MTESLLYDLEAAVRLDPAMRGLISSEAKFGRLCVGHFAAAAKSLAKPNLQIVIVTGFYVPGACPPAAETDGPPGAIRLALALEALGHRVWLLTDSWCKPALTIGAELMGFAGDRVLTFPCGDEEDVWMEAFFSSVCGRELTHLISIERIGPSHTRESLHKQWGEAIWLQEFLDRVPADSWGAAIICGAKSWMIGRADCIGYLNGRRSFGPTFAPSVLETAAMKSAWAA